MALAQESPTPVDNDKPSYSPGLEGVIAGETKLSDVDPVRVSLVFCGYDIKDLAGKASFEEIAYLLLYGKLPNSNEYKQFFTQLAQERKLPSNLVEQLKALPKVKNQMDFLRTATAILALHDPELDDDSHDANQRKAIRLIAKMSTLAAYGYRLQHSMLLIEPLGAELSHAENFLYMVTGQKPGPLATKAFNESLVVYADHGFNASTFSARVTVSTLSDIYSGVVAAIGALKGSLHGGANQKAMEMLLEIGTVENAETWIRDALAQKKKFMGFGHREYKDGDPRATVLMQLAREVGKETKNPKWVDMADIIAKIVFEEKGLHPNVDWATSYTYYMLGLPIEIYTPIFAIGRIAGWTAHIIEQLDNNRLIRPKVIYNGEGYRTFPPMSERT